MHNGIIENYAALKQLLQEKGHVFGSQTDSEVVAHLIEEFYASSAAGNIEQAVQMALREISGTCLNPDLVDLFLREIEEGGLAMCPA